MNTAKLADAGRRAARTFIQAAGAFLVLNPGHVDTAKALAVGAVAAGVSAVWRAFLDPAEPPTSSTRTTSPGQPSVRSDANPSGAAANTATGHRVTTSAGHAQARPPSRRGGHPSGDVPASDLRPPATGTEPPE